MNKKTPSESTKKKHQEELHKEAEFLLGARAEAEELGRKYRMEKNSDQKKNNKCE